MLEVISLIRSLDFVQHELLCAQEQYTHEQAILHTSVALVSTVAAHNPTLVQAAGLHTASLLFMLQGATSLLKVRVS